MRPFLLLPLALVIAAPASAQIPISGLGTVNGGGGHYGRMQQSLRVTDTPPPEMWGDSRIRQRDVNLVGQIGRLERRIAHMRDNGEISRAEARRMRREVRHMGGFFLANSRYGLSDSSAALLQARIDAANSLTATPRVRTR